MNPPLINHERLIVALDVANRANALDLVAQLSGVTSFFKIGLQLYTAVGPEIIQAIRCTGAKVFLDLKLYDIPSTVARAVEAVGKLDVQMLTIHLCGGHEMIEAALSANSSAMKLLGVTVLTSANTQTLLETGIDASIEKQVLRLASLGAAAGLDGFVASPRELKPLRARLGDQATLITPGVRPKWSAAHDQKRFMSPREALSHGADYLVIGRPITSDPNPAAAARRILDEILCS